MSTRITQQMDKNPFNRRQSGLTIQWQWASWRLALVFIISSLLLLIQLTDYTHHFHAHLAKHHILRNLQEQPALRLTFEIKRKAMYVHGVSTFDVIATPAPRSSADDKRMVYDGMASFEEDGALHEYLLVEGTTYYSWRQNEHVAHSTCLPSGLVPPIESVLNAIHTASTAVQSEPHFKCPDGSVMAFQFAGDDFVLCSRQRGLPWLQNDGFQIFGKDLNVRIKFEQHAPDIVAPRVSEEELTLCGKVPFGEQISPSLPSLMTRSFTEWGHRALRTEKAEFFDKIWDLVTDETGCGCKGAQRPCVFVAGLKSFEDYGLTDHDPIDYFGDEIDDHSPCCSSRKYITLDTKLNAWTNPLFQQRLVDLLLQVSGTSDAATKTVKDTIIFGHSMANLILSGAIVNGKVILDPSTSWVASSAPMKGSMGSNFIQEACNGDKGPFAELVIDLLMGRCPVHEGEKSLAYRNSSLSSPELDAAYDAAQVAYAANVDAVICSNSFSGLVTLKSAAYAIAGQVVAHHSPENDGIVEYLSCGMGLPFDTFSPTLSSQRFLSELNHVDTSFRNGDGFFSDSKKPLKWFECLL